MLCRYPIYVEAAGGIVPCGRCFHCRVNKKLKRKSRLLLESRQAYEGKIAFITLTYDDEHLPLSVYDPKTGECYESETGTLDPWQLQKFNKKMRQHYYRKSGRLLRFAAVGEYGGQTSRPHYHLIVFGADASDLGPQGRDDMGPVFKSWTDSNKQLNCDPSRIDIQNPKSENDIAGYISDYIIKGSFEDRQKIAGQKYPEFFRSSQGLGRDSVTGLASAMRTDSAWQYIWDNAKIPHTFEIDGKNYLLDSYMRNKILQHFGPSMAEEIKLAGKEKYDEEMQLLRQAAHIHKKNNLSRHQKDAMVKKFVESCEQEMINREAKFARFNPTKQGL